MEHIKALFFHTTLQVVMSVMVLVTGVLLLRLSAPVLCFKVHYTDLCQLISLKLLASIRGTRWCSHQYYWCHVDTHKGSPQCWQLKGALHVLPGRVHVWGLCAFCATSTPSPCSFALRDGCSMICGYGCHHRSSQWSQHPVHCRTGTHPRLTPVKPPPTTASFTHHCDIESPLPHLYRRFSFIGWPVLQ
jgi:hypothetical protein